MAFHKLLTVTFALLAHSSLTDTEVVPRAVRGGFSSVELSTRATHSSWPVAPLPGGSRLRTISLLAREEPAGAEEDGHGRDHAEEGKSHEHKDDHKVTHNDGHKAHEEHSSQHDGHDDHGHQSHDDHGHHDSHGEHAHGGHEHHGDEDTLLHHNGEHVDEHLQEDAGCAHPVAVGLVAAVIMIPLMISMAMDPGVIGTLTYMLLDTFVSIFLAVLWFNAFSHLVEFFHRRGLDSYCPLMWWLWCRSAYSMSSQWLSPTCGATTRCGSSPSAVAVRTTSHSLAFMQAERPSMVLENVLARAFSDHWLPSFVFSSQ